VVTKHASKKKLKPKRCYRYDHLGTNQEIRPFANDINTLERAVKERLFFVSDGNGGFKAPPKPADKAFTNGCDWILNTFKDARKVVAPLTKDVFLRAYGGHKRRVYENAFKSLEKLSLNSKDYVSKVFVKSRRPTLRGKRIRFQGPSTRGARAITCQ
jgi:cytochrome c2